MNEKKTKKKPRYQQRKIGSQAVWYDNVLGGPIVGEPPTDEEPTEPITTTSPSENAETVNTETDKTEGVKTETKPAGKTKPATKSD